MPLEVAFKLEHDCRLCSMSRTHPEAVIKEWCNNVVEVIHVRDKPERVGAILDELASFSRGVYEKDVVGSVGYLLRQCHCRKYRALLTDIEAAGCVPLFPLVFEAGWERYRALAFTSEQARALMQTIEARVPGVSLVSKREVTGSAAARLVLIPAHEILEGLTPRQVEAMHRAQVEGYYRVPRRTTIEKAAARTTLARATFEEHLRKGESRLMQNLDPYLDLWLQGEHDDRAGEGGREGGAGKLGRG